MRVVVSTSRPALPQVYPYAPVEAHCRTLCGFSNPTQELLESTFVVRLDAAAQRHVVDRFRRGAMVERLGSFLTEDDADAFGVHTLETVERLRGGR